MFKSTGTKIIGLALLAAVVLSGGIYATTALLPGGASAYTASTQPAPAQAAPTEVTPTTEEWRAGMLDMLEDHMGLTGSEAGRFADEMTEHMQGIDSDFDVQEMLDWCTERAGEGGYGPDMMDGYGMMDDYGWGYGGYGMMDQDGNTYGGYGMMGGMMDGYYSLGHGWHMMDTVPLPETGSTDQATTAPTTPEPEQNGYGPGNGSAPGGMMTTPTTGSLSTPQEGRMMEAAPSLETTPTTFTPATPTPPATQGSGFGSYPGGMMGSGTMGSGMMGW